MNGSDKKDFIVKPHANEDGIGLGSFILQTAVKTLIVFFVIFSLAATLFGCLFPKIYMNMYRSLGLYGKAATYATAAADRAAHTHTDGCNGTCEYSSVLTDGVSIAAIAASSDPHSREKWGLLAKLSGDYLKTDCHEKRSAVKDVTYVREYGAKDKASLSVLYGYDDFVWGEYIGALRITDENKAAETVDVAMSALPSAQNAEILNMLIEYIPYYPRSVSEGEKATQLQLQCPHFFEANKYRSLRGVYFDYSELAAALPDQTLVQSAVKSSLLYRLIKLSALMDGLEANYNAKISSEDESNAELKALVGEDVFGKTETDRIAALYAEAIGGKTAA